METAHAGLGITENENARVSRERGSDPLGPSLALGIARRRSSEFHSLPAVMLCVSLAALLLLISCGGANTPAAQSVASLTIIPDVVSVY